MSIETPNKETLIKFLAYNGLAIGMKNEISLLLNNKGISIEDQAALWNDAQEYLEKNPLSIPDAPETLFENSQYTEQLKTFVDSNFTL